MGLGNILNGDQGVGCHILEALSLEPFKDSVQLLYYGDNPQSAGGMIYDTDLLIIVGALTLGDLPGRLHRWDYRVFRQHLRWLIAEHRSIQLIAEAFARADLAGGLPPEILFIWIEPQFFEGYDLSALAKKASLKAVWMIKRKLSEAGLLPEKALRIHPLCH